MRHNLYTGKATLRQFPLLNTPVWLPSDIAAPAVPSPEHWLGKSGEWTDASLWSGGTVPDGQTTAVIARNGHRYTVSIDSQSTVGVLRLDSTSATLAVNADLQLGSLLQIEAGKVDLNGAELSGGRIDVASGATFDVSDGTLANVKFTGILTADNLELGAGVRFGQPDSSTFATLYVAGILDLDGTNTLDHVTIGLSGTIQRDANDPDPSPIVIGSDAVIDVSYADAALGNSEAGAADPVVNHGTINIQELGVLQIDPSTFINHGAINLGAAGVLELAGEMTGQQMNAIVAGVTNSGGGIALSGTVSGGTVDVTLIGGGGTLSNVHYEGTLDFQPQNPVERDLTFAGNIDFSGAGGAGAATIDAVDAGLYFENGVTLSNADVTMTDSAIFTDGTQAVPETLTIASSTTISVVSSATFGAASTETDDMIINHGTISVSSNAGLFLDPNNVVNHGKIELANGSQLVLTGEQGAGPISGDGVTQFVDSVIDHGGIVAIDGDVTGGTLDFTLTQSVNAASFTNVAFQGTINLDHSADLAVNGGTIFAGKDGVGRATINQNEGSLTFESGSGGIDDANIYAGDEAGFFSHGDITLGASCLIDQTGGDVNFNAAGTLTNAGEMDLGFAGGSFFLENATEFANTGTLAIANGEEFGAFAAVKSQTSIVNTAGISMTDGATVALSGTSLTNQASGMMTIANGATTVAAIDGDSKSSVANAGMVSIGGGGSTIIAVAFSNTGTVSSGAGTVQFLGTTANNGAIAAAGGTITFAADVSGHGSLDAASGGTISLFAGSSSGQTVDFLGTNSLLQLTSPLAFLGTIADFGAGNAIDLINTEATGDSFAGGILTVTDDGTTVASLHFSGSYTIADFTIGSDNHGGSLITFS